MGWFGTSKSSGQSASVSASTEEAKETAAKKARLIETEGGNKGAELKAAQGKSVRRIFGG